MRYCLSCHHLSHAGLFCGHCGRSFGCRVCSSKKKHQSPADALYCVECGSADLTEPTSYVPLGWLPRLIAWCGVLVGVKVLWDLVNFPRVIPHILSFLIYWVIILFMVDFCLGLIPGDLSKHLRQMLFGSLRQMFRFGSSLTQQAIRQIARLLFRVVEGDKH